MITTDVEAEDIITQLASSLIESYDTGSGGATITSIITSLLAYQKVTPLITVGTIEPTALYALKISNITILNAIYQLQEIAGGYVSVDNDRALNWLDDIGEDKGQQVRFKKNLRELIKDIQWRDLITRLYPIGSGVTLSDNLFSAVTATKDSDASYGYLTLIEEYACYKDWTALAAALPSNVSVYRQEASYTNIDMDNAGGTGWTNPTYAVDNNTGTYAQYTISSGYWSTSLQCEETSPVLVDAVRIWADVDTNPVDGCDQIEVKVSADLSTWTTVYTGAFDAGWDDGWHTFTFDPQLVRGVTIRFKRVSLGSSTTVYVMEAQLQTDYFDDTSLWLQGADERTMRCAIGDYEAGDDYFVSYTHANFLKAWDKIATYGDITKPPVSNSYITYEDALLEWGRRYLALSKSPPISYTTSAIMLSEISDDFSFDEMQLGSIVNVIDEELGIEVAARVESINYPDLLDPGNVLLEISIKPQDIIDTFKSIFNRL